MSILIQLPAPQLPPIPFFTVTVPLDGATYTLQFQWNDQTSLWTFAVYDNPGQTVLMGIVNLVPGAPLYRLRIQAERTPPGLFFLVDTTGAGDNATLDGLGIGARWQLYYATAAETAALGIR